MILPLLVLVGFQAEMVQFQGDEIAFRAAKSSSGEWIEELQAKDESGRFRTLLVTPTYAAIQTERTPPSVTALEAPGRGLFEAPPTLSLNTLEQREWRDDAGTDLGEIVTLSRKEPGVVFTRNIFLPAKGRRIRVEQNAVFEKRSNPVRYFLSSYAFAPDGLALSQGVKPDSTFSPGLRPKDDQVVGDHMFRAPVISAQKGPLAVLMLPDLDVLAENRPIPTILDLDAKSGVVDATLMSYGFADHKVGPHVYFVHDASMIRNAPKELILAYDLILSARAEPFAAYREAVPYHWERYGKANFDKVLPQVMPFAEYAQYCYPRAFEEAYGANKLGWFEHEINGVVCGGIPAGWGFTSGWVSWQAWFNQLRSAWGLHWWGLKLGNKDWVDKSNKMLNLALAAPMDRGGVPTTYQSREKVWKGCLVTPSPDCYYDLTNMAWKGIWMLRWLEFGDCPRREEILKQCREMAECMMRAQNEDGSFPTWLSKDLKPVPILDRSAGSALPAWFLAELMKQTAWAIQANVAKLEASIDVMPEPKGRDLKDIRAKVAENAAYIGRHKTLYASVADACEFLVRHVVDQQRWYDFETFFSCSPKTCLQRNGLIDDLAMHDGHTLSPPQNTLSMQWAAEALMAFLPLAQDLEARTTSGGFGDWEKELENEADRRASRDARLRAAALKALDIMTLYQNVWSVPYRTTAYTFGGFGVQNSDGEYLDARQSQFGCTLADFGAALGRQDYFERGVAAVRASMTLINHSLHALNGLYPNPNYPPGLQPENSDHGGVSHQAGRTGFDWGEGSGLAGMAWLLHKYGPSYRHPTGGWTVLVDGGSEGLKNVPKPEVLTDPIFDLSDWRLKGWKVVGNFAEIPTFSTRMDFGITPGEPFFGTCEDGKGGFDDSYTGTIRSPYFTATKPSLKLMVGGGRGRGVYAELLACKDFSGEGEQLYVARGQDTERMQEVEWDLTPHKGKTLVLRIVDNETGGWGHINVGRIRVVD